jgi:thioredoxin reductase
MSNFTIDNNSSATNPLPVVIIGAGPVGLAAAAHLLARGETPLVLEAGDAVGASIRQWGHVRFFSPWKYTVDAASVALLAPTGWTLPDPEGAPTGNDIVESYLEPLAALPQIAPHIRVSTRVTAIARRGHDKMKTAGREDAPFVVRIQCPDGGEEQVFSKAVIDASGTWRMPNPLGADGLPAIGEAAAADRIFYGIPDVLGDDRTRYAGKRVVVVGSGHSAFNALLELATLAVQAPGTEITWVVRRAQVGQLFGGEQNDALPERGRLGTRTRQLVDGGAVRYASLRIAEVRTTEFGLVLVGERGETLGPVDEIVCATGFRPDLAITRELRLELDAAVEAPSALAPLIDPNVHSCGSVPPHGAEELKHPEPDFYTVGMKSYGRAPTFLLLTGYEQVRSVVAAIAGDWESARKVELVLPETGVCSTSNSSDEAAACCGTTDAAALPAFNIKSDAVLLPLLHTASLRSPAITPGRTALITVPLVIAAATSSCCSADEQTTCCGTESGSSCAAGERSVITSDLYAVSETADLPAAAVLASLGCGNPTAIAELKAGETVLDLGSGGGIDVLL